MKIATNSIEGDFDLKSNARNEEESIVEEKKILKRVNSEMKFFPFIEKSDNSAANGNIFEITTKIFIIVLI